ncbi:succinyl-diaminopimelate desuccinylase (plasmid) [Legionella adelaidensis]|uniref:Succinyl-diaminopimelate desuccinylase n=1 Tax=Legionella adelaidensis TaxID=45056 RepID=A0A0W0R3V3_9GAMM|nr:succinyl-diaminopimelate desuccinylase [Legionella adelaidensis]KTC65744.1 succinyl-diaminopimelate desuccinylase [Legionella adelaidensis]VEH85090.1 succinyl-diaminopimelate desuccinylase [Legionella adelaidensis]
MSELKELLAKLVSFKSITPEDDNCQNFMISYLEKIGFQCRHFNSFPVNNFFAQIGNQQPLLVFAGHTDVVPVGDKKKWATPPFLLTKKDGLLYGRGTADMKGSLAAMMVAAAKFVKYSSHFNGSLGFLITSGEEGDHYDLGTPYVMSELEKLGIKIDYCIVGEPSSTKKIGDVIKVGRRGSLNGKITLIGKQGHVAYPHLAENPIHNILPTLNELTQRQWDQGNDYFPPTSLQITTIQSGGMGTNVIPGELSLLLNIRYSTEQDHETLKQEIEHYFKRNELNAVFEWRLSGKPFLTEKGKLLESSIQAIKSITTQDPELSTTGGTSDGRFIAPYGVEVIELGPINATIHQVNECVSLNDLETLSEIYYKIAETLL